MLTNKQNYLFSAPQGNEENIISAFKLMMKMNKKTRQK